MSNHRVCPVPSSNSTVFPACRTTWPGTCASMTVSVSSGVATSSTWNPCEVDTNTCCPSPTAFNRVNASDSKVPRSSRPASNTVSAPSWDTTRCPSAPEAP